MITLASRTMAFLWLLRQLEKVIYLILFCLIKQFTHSRAIKLQHL
ncbi:hypothetical protein V527_19375 [Pseudomonas aeruginosa VRFPA06]|nr:hypothetical protein V527_19375 [Pseudomonas aeruginosa VRFPA06]